MLTPTDQLHFIGIDIAKDSFAAAIHGATTKSFPNSPQGAALLAAWARQHYPAGECRCVCESTSQYSRFFAHNLASGPGFSCAIVPPQRVRYAARAFARHTKTDSVDAKTILAFAQQTCPEPYCRPSPANAKLDALRAAIEDLKTLSAELANRQHLLPFTPDAPPAVVQAFTQIQAVLAQELARLGAQIELLFADNADLAVQRQLLQSIPGIGPVLSVELLCVSEVLQQRQPKQLAQYAGLAPAHRQSGASIKGKSMITHAGNRRLRKLLYMAAVSAARHHPHLREFYARLLSAGKPKKLALIAVARKLLLLAQAVMLSSVPYDRTFGKRAA
jgi:transposase